MEVFGVPLGEFVKIVGFTAAVSGGAAAKAGHYFAKRRYYRGDRLDQVVIWCARYVESDGEYVFSARELGHPWDATKFFQSSVLADKVMAAARDANGFIILNGQDSGLAAMFSDHGRAVHDQKRMMMQTERRITGNDPSGVTAWVHERPHHSDHFYFSLMSIEPDDPTEEDKTIMVLMMPKEQLPLLKGKSPESIKVSGRRDEHLLSEFVMMANALDNTAQKSSETAFIWETSDESGGQPAGL